MKTVGIAAEYNPFHRGHACQLSACRRMLGEDAVFAAVMSGDFVQRGEAAMFSKFARAEAACRAGADLVVELPLPWSLASAEGFAAGAVSLMQALQADAVSFGAETDNPEELEELAELFCRPNFHEQVCERMKQHPNRSFPAARQALAEELLGRKLPALQQPNCILAVEYLKAIRQSGRPLRPLAVRREGSGHDDPDASDMPSAAFLRGEIRSGRWPCAALPPEAEQVLRATSAESRMPGTVPASGCITPFRRRPAGRNFFRPLPRGAFRRQGCGAWPSAPPSGCVRKTARGNPRMRGCSPSMGEEERCCMNCPEAAPSRSSQSLPMCGSCRGRPCAISSSAPVRTTSIRSFIRSAAVGRAPEAAARTGGGGRRFVNLLIISKSMQDSALIS